MKNLVLQADSTFLRNISLICGLDEGNNGVKARSIIRSYYHIELSPIEECEEEEPLVGKEELINTAFQNTEGLFYSNSKNISSNTYEIYDILNRKVHHEMTYDELKMCSFIPGIYIVKEKQNNTNLRTIKLWLPIK